MKFTKAIFKRARKSAPKLRTTLSPDIPSAMRVISRREFNEFNASAKNIDELISALKQARKKLGGDCLWWGYDDGTIVLSTNSGKIAGKGTISS